MKINIIFLLVMTIGLFGCKKGTTEPTNIETNGTVTVQGNVSYNVGYGPVEFISPRGFELLNCKWIIPPLPSDSVSSIYLSGVVDSSYLNKHVQVIGTIDTVRTYGSPYESSYLRVNAISIQVIH